MNYLVIFAAVIGFLYILRKLLRLYFSGGKCNQKYLDGKGVDVEDKFIVITGATSGIGYETAKHLVKLGANVVSGCRNLKSGDEMKKKMMKEIGENKKKRTNSILLFRFS
eukprot:EC826269.1.p2 GENE.EC826269.1~~EC826269.1.p2  ORF type:complete len:110 (+),score=50.11 EC826269.1:14-343(+)